MLKFYCCMFLYQSLLEIGMHHIQFEWQVLVHLMNIFIVFLLRADTSHFWKMKDHLGMLKRPYLIVCPRLVKQKAHVSGSICGRTGGGKWEVSACSCTMICFICQALFNKLPMHQTGISLVQGGFSLNLSRWECFLVKGSYLMFTLPKGLSQHPYANLIRHNPCLKHFMVWAHSSAGPGVSQWMSPRWQLPVLLGPVTSFINSVILCIYFWSLVSGRERAGG